MSSFIIKSLLGWSLFCSVNSLRDYFNNLASLVNTIVPEQFWHKLNYFSFYGVFVILFIICAKFLFIYKIRNLQDFDTTSKVRTETII
jgi:hypothetical protein